MAGTRRLQKAVLYGSRAKGNCRHGSDIDLVLEGDTLTLTDLHQLEDQLDDLLLPYHFDISLYYHIDNPDLIAHIQQIGIVFYEAAKVSVDY